MKFTQVSLSVKDRKRLEQAKKIAATSTCTYKHGCVAVSGGRVIAVGVNNYRNSPEVFDHIPHVARSTHAEMAALRALNGVAQGSTFYVARVNRRGEERMSKPCNNCQIALKAAGVKRVVYTIDSSITL